MQYRTNMARGFSVFPPEVSNIRIIVISETFSLLIVLVLAKFAIAGRSKSCMQQKKQVTQQLQLFSRGSYNVGDILIYHTSLLQYVTRNCVPIFLKTDLGGYSGCKIQHQCFHMFIPMCQILFTRVDSNCTNFIIFIKNNNY